MKKLIGLLAFVLLGFSFSLGKEKIVIEYNNKIYKDKVIETFNGNVELSNTLYPKKFYINSGSQPSYVNEIVPAHDGGWLASETISVSNSPLNTLVKYKADGTVEWEKEFKIPRYGTSYMFRYSDNVNRVDFYGEPSSVMYYSAHQVLPSADGNYFVVSANQTGVITKIDPDGNVIWYNKLKNINSPAEDVEYGGYYYQLNTVERVCPIDSEHVNAQGKYKRYESTYGTSGYNESRMYFYDLEPFQIRDDNTYYCGWRQEGVSFNNLDSTESDIAALPDGGVAVLIRTGGNIFKQDGTQYRLPGGLTIYVWDKDGNLVDAIPVNETANGIGRKYYQEYGIDYTYNFSFNRFFYLGSYDNGDLLMIASNNAIKYTKGENGKYQALWYTPISANGTLLNPQYNKSVELQVQVINETGGFAITSDSSITLDGDNMTNNYNYMYRAENVIIDRELEPWYDDYSSQNEGIIFEFEEKEHSGHRQAYLNNLITTFGSYRNDINIEQGGHDQDKICIESPSSFKYPSFMRLSDGSYIVSVEYFEYTDYDGLYYGGDFYRTVNLADGSKYKIKKDTKFLVYRVNKNNKIEWIKQYKIMSPGNTIMPYVRESNNTGKSRISMDGRRILIPAVVLPSYKMITNDGADTLVFYNDTSVPQYYGNSNMFLIFDLQYDREVIKDPETTTKETIKTPEKVTENPPTGVKDYIKEFIAILLISGILYFVVIKLRKKSMLNR